MPPKAIPTIAQRAQQGRAAVVARPVLDPLDVVMLGYPPLQDYGFVALVGVPCAESALRLAYTRAVLEKDIDASNIVEGMNRFPAAMNMQEMRRRLQRLKIEHFPIYAYNSAADDFAIVHGKPRKDHFAIAFIPADGPALVNAHWTYGTILPPVNTDLEARAPPGPVVVFSEAPLHYMGHDVFWRTVRRPENEDHYQIWRTARRACDCAFHIRCAHEHAFRILMTARHGVQIRTVSLLSNRMIEGASRANIQPVTVAPHWKVIRSPNNSVTVVTDRGHRMDIQDAYDNSVISKRPRSVEHFGIMWMLRKILQKMELLESNPQYEPVSATEQIDLPPFRCNCVSYEQPQRRFTWLQPLSSVAVGGALSVVLHRAMIEMAPQVATPVWCAAFFRAFGPKMVSRGVVAAAQAASVASAYVSSTRFEQVINAWYRVLGEDPTWFNVPDWFHSTLRRVAWRRIPNPDDAQVDLAVRQFDDVTIWNRVPGPGKDVLVQQYDEVYLKMYCAAKQFARFSVESIRNYVYFDLATSLLSNIGSNLWKFWKIVKRDHIIIPVVSNYPRHDFGRYDDLNLQIEGIDKIVSRLAVRDVIERQVVVDIVRRVMNENHWEGKIPREAFNTWLERVVTEEAMTPSYPAVLPGHCIACLKRAKLKWLICKPCRKFMKRCEPERIFLHDSCVLRVGPVALWSMRYPYPNVGLLKPECSIVIDGVEFKTKGSVDIDAYAKIKAWAKTQEMQPSCRGMLCGPMFMGQRPMCYPRGRATALLAFCCRLGCERDYAAVDWIWPLFFQWLEPELLKNVCCREGWLEFIAHFVGEKKRLMIEANNQLNEGYFPKLAKIPAADGNGTMDALLMKGFTKAEKGYDVEYSMGGEMKQKEFLKPRFICCPDPLTQRICGPVTHKMLKLLSGIFNLDSFATIACCLNPSQLNRKLNMTIEDLGEFAVWAGDISRCDSNHSKSSANFIERVRDTLLPNLEQRWNNVLRACDAAKICFAMIEILVYHVNFSGKAGTTVDNTLLNVVISTFAMVYAFVGFDQRCTVQEFEEKLARISPFFRGMFSGDDGDLKISTALPWADKRVQARYSEFWTLAGFTTKLIVYPPHRWRLGTFLAMRPVWNGKEYQYTPEPARRLRGMFWQIDKSLHPIAWARGVATQVAKMSPHNPILKPICDWYLERTHGPICTVQVFGNPNNPFATYEAEGGITERSINEFLVDYGVKRSDYDTFLSMLRVTEDVFVDFSCFLIDRVYQEES
jgi:hypothetical protein